MNKDLIIQAKKATKQRKEIYKQFQAIEDQLNEIRSQCIKELSVELQDLFPEIEVTSEVSHIVLKGHLNVDDIEAFMTSKLIGSEKAPAYKIDKDRYWEYRTIFITIFPINFK